MLNGCVQALQEVKDAPSPSFSSSSIRLPEVLDILYTSVKQRRSHIHFVLHAVYLLACCYQEPVISILLQKNSFIHFSQKGLLWDRYVYYPLPHCNGRLCSLLEWGQTGLLFLPEQS